MNKVKRKFNSNQCYNKGMKKLRRNADIDQETISITCLENFSNEFFYEIFDYLDGCDIYEVFSNLNHRFEQLLNSSSLLFKIKFDSLSKNFYKQILALNKHKIFSLNLRNLLLKRNNFFSSFPIDSSLSRLESLTLIEPDSNVLMSVLFYLPSLPHFSSLTIDVFNASNNSTDIYRIVFSLSKLKYFKFSSSIPGLSISLPIPTNKQYSPIKYLVIDHHCTSSELSDIISYTPQLFRLNFTDMDVDHSNNGIILPMALSNLTVLSHTSLSEDIIYLDAARWEEFILKYLPKLEKFYFQYHEHIDYNDESPFYLGQPNQFTSSFWIDRQWIFESKSECHSIIYSVCPYKKRWYEYDTELKLINSSQLSKSTQLTLTDIPPFEYQELITRNITRALTLAQYYHLEIQNEQIFNGALLQAVDLLPELITLKIHSLSLEQHRDLCEKEVDILLSRQDTSKITKVYLETMMKIADIYFLMVLCPYMKYLRVDCINNMDVELFIRKMLNKINFECNQYLRSLCFCVSATDDEVIKKLEKMINTEKLLVDYSIKRVCDHIYLQWK